MHANTVRTWTDQGRLCCLRINERGDRRYRVADLRSFLDVAGLQASPAHFAPRTRPSATTWAVIDDDRTAMSRPATEEIPGPRTGARVPDSPSRRDSDIAAVARLTGRQWLGRDLDAALRNAARTLLGTGRFAMVGIAEWRDGQLVPHLVDGVRRARNWWAGVDTGLAEVCAREGRMIATPSGPGARRGRVDGSTVQVFCPITAGSTAWGIMVAESAGERAIGRSDLDLLAVVAGFVELMADRSRLAQRVVDQRAQAHALARMSADLSSRLEFPVVVSSLVEHAIELFRADRAAVWRMVDGRLVPEFARGLSATYVDQLAGYPPRSIAAMAIRSGGAVAASNIATDPRVEDLRSAMQREGIASVALAPLVANGEALAVVSLYHDELHEWSADDLQVLEGLANQATVAVTNARNYQQMATWAAQLQSIQQLGTRLNRLSTVTEIGHAICTELRQLIDYHNVRVYRVRDGEVEPIAWRGDIGEYTQEDSEGLRLKVGFGITGWVAQHGISQILPDAAADPRSQTIPGTVPGMAESMLLAPMLDDDRVIGVIVLSKLGISQFAADDLRYLEIYASIAAQALVRANATEELRAQSDRLARQLASQRELMQVTESILSTLDPRAVVEEIADRIGGLLRVDNVAIDVYDQDAHLLRPLFARGVDSEAYMARPFADTEGVSGWVARRGEAQLVQDVLEDPRWTSVDGLPQPGAMIVAPLRSRDRVTGTLLVERIGPDARFDDLEFELIQLFAGHVSIALQNALAHRAVEIRAQTDALTGLKNQGTFQEYLGQAVQRGALFSLLIVDLDEFKLFNDRRGHEAGNGLLMEIGRALRASCRDSDEVFRYGGDEFALILPNTDVNGAMEVAAKVSRAVRNAPITGSRRPAGVTCSVGVAGFPADGEDQASLLLAADRACYVAKRNGRNHAVTAADGLAVAGDVLLQPPTPVDSPIPEANAA